MGGAGAGPDAERLVVDVDSFVGEVYGYAKQGAGYGYTHKRGYHPIVATRAATAEVLHRARKGSANTSRGALRFVEELIPRVARAGATGPRLLRADPGFWNTKIMARLQAAGWTYSIGVRQQMRSIRRLGAGISHLHEFELAGGRRIGFVDPDPFEGQIEVEGQEAVKVAQAVEPGDEFEFVFDFGDRWRHRCGVLAGEADPREEYGAGPLPKRPVPTWGWGSIPDQYGRDSAADLDLEP